MDTDELERIQQQKTEFAATRSPPIDPCTNVHCKFTGCVCGTTCGCGVASKKTAWVQDIKGGDVLVQCDPCKEFKASKKKAKIMITEEENEDSTGPKQTAVMDESI